MLALIKGELLVEMPGRHTSYGMDALIMQKPANQGHFLDKWMTIKVKG